MEPRAGEEGHQGALPQSDISLAGATQAQESLPWDPALCSSHSALPSYKVHTRNDHCWARNTQRAPSQGFIWGPGLSPVLLELPWPSGEVLDSEPPRCPPWEDGPAGETQAPLGRGRSWTRFHWLLCAHAGHRPALRGAPERELPI